MTIGSLFSGIGGIELALESLGLGPVIWQAESDVAARRVLAKHWPLVHRYTDVRQIDATTPRPEIICGGFPCQDISVAGAGVGIDGERSGLWREFARIVRALEPGIVFVENVPALASRGLDEVLRDLAACGLDAEWDCFSAADVGAPHKRERIFVLAYADGERIRQLSERDQRRRRGVREAERGDAEPLHDREALADTAGAGRARAAGRAEAAGRPAAVGRGDAAEMADTDRWRREGERLAQSDGLESARGGEPDGRSDVGCVHTFPPGPGDIGSWPGAQPAVRRVDARIPFGLDRGWRAKNGIPDRLRLLGNACVPQQAALAFRTLAARAAAAAEGRAA